MPLTTEVLRQGLGRIAAAMEAAAPELNTLDGELGDGDLGVTMQRGCREVATILAELPDDLGLAFGRCAQAFTKQSGSSFGTLLATGLMSASKATKNKPALDWSEISRLLGLAVEAMMARGKAQLDDKTVLDALEAARTATAGLDDPDAILEAADKAVGNALEAFRDKPIQAGRGRIFAAKSIGLDDPGMVAVKRILDALKEA